MWRSNTSLEISRLSLTCPRLNEVIFSLQSIKKSRTSLERIAKRLYDVTQKEAPPSKEVGVFSGVVSDSRYVRSIQ
jgi:hypothetical protein